MLPDVLWLHHFMFKLSLLWFNEILLLQVKKPIARSTDWSPQFIYRLTLLIQFNNESVALREESEVDKKIFTCSSNLAVIIIRICSDFTASNTQAIKALPKIAIKINSRCL